MNDIDLDKLELLATGAVPGPWQDEESGGGVFSSNEHLPPKRAYGVYGDLPNFVCDLNDGEYHEYRDIEEQKNTAAYIAAMNPETTKALIARIRELEDENKKLR